MFYSALTDSLFVVFATLVVVIISFFFLNLFFVENVDDALQLLSVSFEVRFVNSIGRAFYGNKVFSQYFTFFIHFEFPTIASDR